MKIATAEPGANNIWNKLEYRLPFLFVILGIKI